MMSFEREKEAGTSSSVQTDWLARNEFVFPRVVLLFAEAQKNKTENTTSFEKHDNKIMRQTRTSIEKNK